MSLSQINPPSASAAACTQERLLRAYLVRIVEEELLRLFAAGKLSGTTHTCIGQELSAVALTECLDRTRDLIFSNHRCHGHYLAWTGDVEGLLAEVMGRATGVCAGLGGSQHLNAQGFYSNGIQGGIVPVATGLAFAQKLAGGGGITAVCIGDGTLGEGAIYEAFNIAVKWNVPLLVLLENNLYAQSTSQTETLAGDICARAAAFGMRTFMGDTWHADELAQTLAQASGFVRTQCAPAFVRVDTYRLAAHSKGDDDRKPEEIAAYALRDPVNQMLALPQAATDGQLAAIRERVRLAIERAEAAVLHSLPARSQLAATQVAALRPRQTGGGSQLDAINRALGEWLTADPNVILLGEDIRSPYGGAFKVTRGLSDAHPDRVLNTPISEAAIVGVGNGLALGGRRPVVEIMFGDFLTLCCDQLINHAAKFHGMYNGQVSNPLVVRAPMGGGRGYGPTHSQNLEKHFAGVPGLKLLVLHGRTDVPRLYASLRTLETPLLMIENKLLYRERGDAPLPADYTLADSAEPFATTVLSPRGQPDVTVVAFGRMSALAERAAARLAEEEEIDVELVFPLQVSPLDVRLLSERVARTGRLLVVEEGACGFDLGSEVIAAVVTALDGRRALRVRRLAAHDIPIPSALALEQQVLPGVDDIAAACVELFE